MPYDLPLVTVGIPTYNRPNGLANTLNCIINQTYQNLEVLVSDNCSTNEEVSKLLIDFENFDKRVKVTRQKSNISIVPNFQYLLNNAKGKYFMWAADDDNWESNFIEVCVTALENNPNCVLAIPDVRIVNSEGIKEPNCIERSFVHKNLYKRFFDWIRQKSKNTYFFCGLYNTNAIKDIPFYNFWGGDHFFLLETLTKGGFIYLPDKSCFYYYRGGSSTSTARIKQAFNIESNFFYPESYIFKYAYFHFRFKHISIWQKFGLFFINILGLVFNKEFILYYAIVKKPIKNLFSVFKKTG